jgi:hypothetical protein
MSKIRQYTRKDLYQNAQAYNKYLTLEFLSGLSWKMLLAFCHPSLRDEIRGLGTLI